MTSEAKTTKQDALPKEGQSSAGGGSKPSTQPEVFTKEQVAERHSKLDKQISDLTKANQAKDKAIETANARAESHAKRLAEIEEQKDRDELQGIKDSPDALSLWQARQTHKEVVREHEAKVAAFEQERSGFLTELEEVKSYKTFKTAMEIVSKPEYKGVDAQKLVDLTDGSPDKMEGVAKLLKAALGQTKPDFVPPDSSGSSGGAGEPTAEELDAMPMDKFAEWYNKRHPKK